MSVIENAVERVFIEPAVWVETRRKERSGRGFYVKSLVDGKDGGLRATLSIQPAGFENPAHFHTTNQFQVILEGSVQFPTHSLTAPAVHYSDHGTPYGPFVVGPDFKMAIIRTHAAEQIYMSDQEGRKRRNPYGRELFGQAGDQQWASAPGQPDGVEGKMLFGAHAADGDTPAPFAELLRCPAGIEITSRAVPHGQYLVVLDGSVAVDETELVPYSMRYAAGPGRPQPFRTGADGATVIVLAFDSDE